MKEIKISKQGMIILPKELKKRFSNSPALLIESNEDLIILRKTAKLTLAEIVGKLQEAGPKVNKYDIENAIAQYRKAK